MPSKPTLPTILVGAISKPGDVDYYKINVKAGEQLVFENGAAMLGSTLQPVVRIYDADQALLKEYGLTAAAPNARSRIASTRPARTTSRCPITNRAAVRVISIASWSGKFPLALAAFPLGVQKGKTAEVALTGYNLGDGKLAVKGEPRRKTTRSVMLRPKVAAGKAFNELKLAVSDEPEVASTGKNTSLAAAQAITAPVTIDGKLLAEENDFRFKARKGEKLVFEVQCQPVRLAARFAARGPGRQGQARGARHGAMRARNLHHAWPITIRFRPECASFRRRDSRSGDTRWSAAK